MNIRLENWKKYNNGLFNSRIGGKADPVRYL